MKRLHVGAVLALLLVLCVPHAAHASIGLTIQPTKASITMNPGETAMGTIILTNASDRDVLVDETVQDFIPVGGAEGLQFVERAPGVTSVRDWITIDGKQEFIFPQGKEHVISYTITAPADAEPGSHFGVIFFKASDAAAKGSLKVGTQVGVPLLVTIPGEHLQKGTILSFTAPPFSMNPPIPLYLKFQNIGTVYFEPKGTITITNMLGKVVGSVPIEGQIVLPTGAKDLYFEWRPSGLLFGQYKAYAQVVDGEGQVLTSKEISFYVAPLNYIGYFLVTVLLFFFALRYIKKHISITLR